MDAEAEIQLAKSLFNSCWDLIEKTNRTLEEDAEMVHLAHTSRWHWGNVGGLQERAMGEWQCARVNAILGNANAALLHATLSAQLVADLPNPNFMKASSSEALAYAYYLLGEVELANKYKREALALLDGVNEQDAHHIREQIQELPF